MSNTPKPRCISAPGDRTRDDVTTDVWMELQDRYRDRFFWLTDKIAVIESNGTDIELRVLTLNDFRHALDAAICYYRPATKTEPEKFQAPAKSEVEVFYAAGRTFCPPLLGIIRVPYLMPDGNINFEYGYNKETRLFSTWEHGEVENAHTDVIGDVISRLLDFPFATNADKDHALGLYLLPFVRPAIDGPTPLHLITADHAKAGKTYLGEMGGYVAHGRKPAVYGFDGWGSEASRQLTAYLISAPDYLLLDNLPTKMMVSNADMNRFLTAHGPCEIRQLGRGTSQVLNVRCTWCATGVDPDVDEETSRRTIPIRLEERPTDWPFLTPNLRKWVVANRLTVIGVFITIIRNWQTKGKPGAARSLPSYEAWSDVVGGIVSTTVRSSDWLNPDHRPIPKVEKEWAELFEKWPLERDDDDSCGKAWLSAGDAYNRVRDGGCDAILSSLGVQSQHAGITKLGHRLKDYATKHKPIARDWRVDKGYNSNRGSGLYRPVFTPATVKAATKQAAEDAGIVDTAELKQVVEPVPLTRRVDLSISGSDDV